MKKIYFLILSAFVGFSCSNQTELNDIMGSTSLPTYQMEGISRNSNSISESDALFVASRFMNRPATRSNASTVTPLRDSENKLLGHIINYSDKGFCIVAASKESSPILAYSDDNRFDVSSIDKTGVCLWLENYIYSQNNLTEEQKAINRQQWEIYEAAPAIESRATDDQEKTAAMNKRIGELYEEFGGGLDARPLIAYRGSSMISESLYQLFKNKGGSENYTIVARYKKDLGIKIEPYIKTQWHQEGPFGKYADNGVAGCTVIAAGQLMYYFQFPTTYDWVAIAKNNFNNEALSRFSRDVQDRFQVTYHYTPIAETSATISKVKKGLESFGYKISHEKSSSSYRFVYQNHTPFYEQGIDDAGNGHAWVVDGYNSYDYQYYYVVEYLRGSSGSYYYERDNTTYSADDGNPAVTYQVHYNWGWGGDNDGYYVSPPTYKNDVQQLILKH